MNNFKHSNVTEQIIKAFYSVYNTLGYGFLEKVYENAMMIELNKLNLSTIKQMPIEVYYENQNVGMYYADICVDNKVFLELKAVEDLSEAHEFQLINYLKATHFEVGLLLNFGKTPQFKRKVFSEANKNFKKS